LFNSVSLGLAFSFKLVTMLETRCRVPPGWDATAVASVGPVREDMTEKQDKEDGDEKSDVGEPPEPIKKNEWNRLV